MTGPFGATSTTDDVLEGVDLTGKRILVTGASAGLGVETARALVAHGAQVVGAVRDLEKAHRATEPVRAAAAESGGGLELVTLDLASLASVRACADALVAAGKPFDLIIANAGIMACPPKHDDRRLRDAVRHQSPGPFRPGQPYRRPAELGRAAGEPVLRRPSLLRREYRGPELRAHALQRVRRLWPLQGPPTSCFAVEFDRRHREGGIRATAVHPGVIQTELGRHMTPEVMRQIIPDDGSAPTFTWKTIPQGAATSIWSGRRRPGRPRRRPLLRGLPRGRAAERSRGARRRAFLRPRPRPRQGAVGQERGDGRRDVLTRPSLTRRLNTKSRAAAVAKSNR